MITWRGKPRVSQALRQYRADVVKVRTLFTIYDTAESATPIRTMTQLDEWPLDAFRGLTLNQRANLILNVGLVGEGDPGAPPGETPPPDPRPLRETGAAFCADYLQCRMLMEAGMPNPFGP